MSCMNTAVLATGLSSSSEVFLVSPRGPETCTPGLPPSSFHSFAGRQTPNLVQT